MTSCARLRALQRAPRGVTSGRSTSCSSSSSAQQAVEPLRAPCPCHLRGQDQGLQGQGAQGPRQGVQGRQPPGPRRPPQEVQVPPTGPRTRGKGINRTHPPGRVLMFFF